jgi:hypothetical protein
VKRRGSFPYHYGRERASTLAIWLWLVAVCVGCWFGFVYLVIRYL